MDAYQQARWQAATDAYQAQREQALWNIGGRYAAQKQRIVLEDGPTTAAEGGQPTRPPSRPPSLSAAAGDEAGNPFPALPASIQPPSLRTTATPPIPTGYFPAGNGAGSFTPGTGRNPQRDGMQGLTPPANIARGGQTESAATRAVQDTTLGSRATGARSRTGDVSPEDSVQRKRGVVRGDEGTEMAEPGEAPRFASVAEAEQAIRHLAYEILAVFSADDKYLAGAKGEKSEAYLDPKYHHHVKNSICVHNHPSGNVFSPTDMQFIRDLNPADFRVVTTDRRFTLLRPGDKWPDDFMQVYSKWYTTSMGRHREKMKNKFNEKEFTRRVFQDALKRTVEELKLDFREEEL